MYDVYVSDKRGLLVVVKGDGVPSSAVGNCRKKRRTRAVSTEIRDAVYQYGYYRRNGAVERASESRLPEN